MGKTIFPPGEEKSSQSLNSVLVTKSATQEIKIPISSPEQLATITKPDAYQEIPVLEEENSYPPIDAAIKEELKLRLVEVINPEKWPNGLWTFSGDLITKDGIIEVFSLSLDEKVEFTSNNLPLSGNVFIYDLEFESYNGVFYQTDTDSYVVSLSDGPYAGTRLVFQNQEPTNSFIIDDI